MHVAILAQELAQPALRIFLFVMAPKAAQTIELAELKELGRRFLKEPNVDHYMADDVNLVVKMHYDFFLAAAEKTKRLNPNSLALMAKDVFQSSVKEAQLYGNCLAPAFSHCMCAGGKATNGKKLSPEVLAVYNAACGHAPVSLKRAQTEASAPSVKSEVMKRAKHEIASPKVMKHVKDETLSPPAKKPRLKACLSSPSQIAALYSGSSRSSASSRVKELFF